MKTTKTNNAYLNKSKIALVTKTLFSLIFMLALTITSCTDPEEQEESDKPDGAALTELFQNNRKDAVQEFTVNIDGGAVITGTQGTQVTFPANSLGLNGTPVTGNVTVELVEIYGKGAMLLQNMPTSGIKPDGTQEALKSAGEFFLNAKQGENQLEILIPVQIQSRDIDPATWEQMQVFKAGDDLQDTDLWEEVKGEQGGVQNAEGGEGEGPDGDYVMFSIFDISSFGWANLDIWFSYTGAKTQIYVDVPAGFDGDNCEVYLSYDGEPTALARMDIYNSTTELFTEHYGQIPIGHEVHIILVAEISGELHYTIQGTTVVDNHTEVMADPQPTTQANLEALINALP